VKKKKKDNPELLLMKNNPGLKELNPGFYFYFRENRVKITENSRNRIIFPNHGLKNDNNPESH